jgi:hypothetical protein
VREGLKDVLLGPAQLRGVEGQGGRKGGIEALPGLLLNSQDELSVVRLRARQQTRAAVQSTIRVTLHELPQEPLP